MEVVWEGKKKTNKGRGKEVLKREGMRDGKGKGSEKHGVKLKICERGKGGEWIGVHGRGR